MFTEIRRKVSTWRWRLEVWIDRKQYRRIIAKTLAGLAMAAMVVWLCIQLFNFGVWFIGQAPQAPEALPPSPPALDAPLLDIVRWCETHARDTKSRTTYVPVTIGKMSTMQARVSYYTVDAPDKYLGCMLEYDIIVKR